MASQKNHAKNHAKNHTLLLAALFGPLLGSTVYAQTPLAAAPQSQPAAQSPRAAQKTVTQTVTFSASNQNYWPGAAGSLQPVQLFPKQPDGTNTITFTPPLPFNHINLNLPQPGDSIDFSGSATNLKAGLTLNAYATPGGVNINYPGSLALTTDPQLTPNATFSFSTSFTRDQTNSSLAITPPNFDATLGGIVAGDFNLSGVVRTPGSLPNFNFSILNKSIDTTFDILDVQKDLVAPLEQYGGLGVSHDLNSYIKEIPAGVLSFQINDPRIFDFTNASVASSPALSYNGYQTLLDLNGDISNLVGYLGYAAFTGGQSLPQGLFNASYSYGGSSGGYGATVGANYQIADLYGDVPFGFEQNFTFQATPKMTVTLLGPNGKQVGQTATVIAGSGGNIAIPATYADETPVLPYGVTSVPITVQTALDFSSNTLHNDTNFQCKPGLYFQPYSFSASASVEFAGENVFSISDGFSDGNPITLASNTFSVRAFSNDKTIAASDYSVSPSVVTSTLNYIGTSIDQPHPALSGMSRNNALAGAAGFPLTLTGTGFTTKSQASVSIGIVTGATQQTLNAKYLSPTSLQISLPSADLRTPATLSLSVFNPGLPAPATYNSTALPFLVALPGCYLNAAAAFQTVHLTQPSPLNITLSNNSTVDATDVHLISAVLNGTTASAPELALGTIKSGASASPVHYDFPPSAIPASGPARLVLTGTFNGKPFTLTVPVTVPTPSLTASARLSVKGLAGLAPSTLMLTLKNDSIVDADAVVVNSVRVNGYAPSSGTRLPLTIGALGGGASSAQSEYGFSAQVLPPRANSAQLVVTGTQQGKPFTVTIPVPVSLL